MDTTYVVNQVRIPTDICTTVSNITDIPDSLIIKIPDTIKVVQEQVPEVTIWGLTPEWGAIIIPTIASIVVFGMGIWIESRREKKKRLKETVAFRNTIFSWVELMDDTVCSQIVRIRKLVDDIKNNTGLQNVRFEFSKSMIDKLDIISADNVLKYFIFRTSKPYDDRRSKNAFNIISSIDYLKSSEIEIMKAFSEYQHYSESLMAEWNQYIISAQEHIMEGTDSKLEQDVFSRMQNTLSIWQIQLYHQSTASKELELDMKKAYDSFIRPMQDILSENTIAHSGYEKTDVIRKDIKSLFLVYQKWETANNGYAQLFSDYANQCAKSYSQLMSAIEYFKLNTTAIH